MTYTTDRQLDQINKLIISAAALRRKFPDEGRYADAHHYALEAKQAHIKGQGRASRVAMAKAHSYLAD